MDPEQPPTKGRGMKTLLAWPHYVCVCVLLVCASLAIHARESTTEVLPPHLSLSQFPVDLGAWHGRDLALDPDVVSTLGPGQFLLRNYGALGKPPTNLFIYYPSLARENNLHSPRNCLPGAGWTPIRSARMQIQRENGPPIDVNRFIVGKGRERVLVLYWYQGRGRVIPSEFWAKYFLFRDAVLKNRTDSALVRIVQPLTNVDEEPAAERQAVAFVQQILPILNSYIPN
jgi:EpsI family protein